MTGTPDNPLPDQLEHDDQDTPDQLERDDQDTPDQLEHDDQVDPAAAPRFAVYDTRLKRFVRGVHDSESAARAAGKSAGVKARDLETREV